MSKYKKCPNCGSLCIEFAVQCWNCHHEFKHSSSLEPISTNQEDNDTGKWKQKYVPLLLVIAVIVCSTVTSLLVTFTGQIFFVTFIVPVIIGLIVSLPISLVVYSSRREHTSTITMVVFMLATIGGVILIFITGGLSW